MSSPNGKRRLLTALWMVGVMGFAAAAPAAPAKSCIKPQRLTGAITVDGRLDEPAWQAAAPSSDFVRLEIFKKDTPPAKTTVKLLCDDDAVYLGVHCAEPLMSRVKEFATGRDSDVFSMDCLEIFLAPGGRSMNFYQFVLSINNAQWDIYWGEKGHINRDYNGLWTSGVFRGPDFWTAEIRIPLSDFYFTPASAFSDTWLVNVCRERKPEWDLLTCAPLKKSFLREPDGFLRVKGLPKKPRAVDLTVTKGEMALTAKTDKGYEGAVDVEIACNDRAAYGDYTLAILADETNLLVRQAITLSQPVNTFSLDGVSVAELKPMLLKVALATRVGKPAGGALFPTVAQYQPLKITVNEPFYSNCIYPGQDVKTIAGDVEIKLPLAQLKGASLDLLLKGSNVEQRLTREVTNKVVGFSFEAVGLAVGEYALSAEVRTAGGVVAEAKTRIRKLPEGPHVYIDRNLNFVVHGKPMVARGWYGEGYLLCDALRRQYDGRPNSRFVNLWGNMAGLEAERIDPDPAEKERSRSPVRPSQKVFDSMRATIDACRTNANCWWYYLCDEPECRLVSPVYLKYQYDFIKDLDPSRPVMIITQDPARYVGCADILSPHDYLCPTITSAGQRTMTSPKLIRRHIRTVYSDGKHRIAAWATPQAFSYVFIDSQQDYPTFDEYNCMVFTALANGCKGYTPYIYFDHFNSLDLRLGCDFIYESIAYLEDFLLGPPDSLPVAVTAPDDGVDVMVRQRNGQILVVAVNLLDRPVRAAVESPALKGCGRLYGFRENREVRLRRGSMTLDFAPYQVQILTQPKLGTELKLQEQFLAELAAARAALKKPGNILFGMGRSIEWNSSSAQAGYTGNLTLYSLTDGICDAYGWTSMGGDEAAPWIEAYFQKFVPKFKSAKIYSTTVEDLDFFIWKDADWKKIGGVKGNRNPVITLSFPEQVSTVKLRIVMPKYREHAEVYEIELYE